MSVRMSLYVGHIIGSIFCNVVQHPFDNITVVYVISCRNFWLQYRDIQDGGPKNTKT